MTDNTQLAEGFALLSRAIRAGEWSTSLKADVTPTQAAILKLAHDMADSGMTVRDVSQSLSISQPTATDSVAALVRKGLLRKQRDKHDRRSSQLRLTASGARAVESIRRPSPELDEALASLGEEAHGELTRSIMLAIRSMQETGIIAPHKLCITCRHFKPYAHTDAAQPHHCAFVDAAFGNSDLRFACREHEMSSPASQAATWSAFAGTTRPSEQTRKDRQ